MNKLPNEILLNIIYKLGINMIEQTKENDEKINKIKKEYDIKIQNLLYFIEIRGYNIAQCNKCNHYDYISTNDNEQYNSPITSSIITDNTQRDKCPINNLYKCHKCLSMYHQNCNYMHIKDDENICSQCRNNNI